MSDGNDLRLLLKLQEKDTAIDQLLHRRDHSPIQAELDAVMVTAADIKKRLDAATGERDATAKQQESIEAEVQTLDKRIEQINVRLYGPNPPLTKDAQAMSTEVEHLKAKKSELEDEELEAMEQLEPLSKAVADVEVEARTLAGQIAEIQSRLTAERSDLETQLAAARVEREAAAANVDPVLMAKYEPLRKQLGGVAVAELDGSRCGGCHLTMSGAELDAVRKAADGALVNCEECGRILVH